MGKQILTAQEYLAKADHTDDPAEQIRCCTQALELDPELPLAYFLRGNGYANLNQNEKRLPITIRLSTSTRDGWRFHQPRHLPRASGQDAEAVEDFSRALEINPENADAYTYRGNCHAHLDQDEEAIEDYSQKRSA